MLDEINKAIGVASVEGTPAENPDLTSLLRHAVGAPEGEGQAYHHGYRAQADDSPPLATQDAVNDQALTFLRGLVAALEQQRIRVSALAIEHHMDHLSAGGGVFPVPNGVHTLTLTFAEC